MPIVYFYSTHDESVAAMTRYVTRNSAVADKPRDAFVQYVMAKLTLPP